MSSSDPSNRRRFLKAGLATSIAAAATTLAARDAHAQGGDSTQEREGTLLRGADGKLYFIPDDALRAFVLDDRKTAALESRFGEGMKAAAVNLSGKDVFDSGVGALKIKNVLLLNVATWRTGATALKAREAAAARDAPKR